MTNSALTDSTVLVTGGAGFIGGHIAARLADDVDLRILDNFSSGRRERVPGTATVIEGDIRDPDDVDEAMAGVDVVFHEAAMVSVPASVDNPMECHDINGTGSVNVLEAARRNDSRVVIASSAAIYGQPESVPVSETDSTNPTSPYGLEKLLADQYARIYAAEYGLASIALRYFNVYGPGQQGGQYAGVIKTFLEQARTGDPITVEGDGKQTRDFVHVDDIVDANLLAATTDTTETAFNIGTGQSVTIKELAESVRSVVGADVPIVHTDPRANDIEHSEADISRARASLGYEPTISISDGLESIVR